MNGIDVHQVWLQGEDAVPCDVRGAMETWRAATGTRPGSRHRVWDDRAIRALLPDVDVPRIRTIYETLPETLYGVRADIARLVVLVCCGGVYADADTRAFRPARVFEVVERALVREGADVVVGAADLAASTAWWRSATRRPSNFLMACRPGSRLVRTYLASIADDFDARGIGRALAAGVRPGSARWRRITKTWTGPRKLRAVLRAAPPGAAAVTPPGFVACAGQRCFPDAALAHDYASRWYPRSAAWTAVRGRALRALVSTPLDAALGTVAGIGAVVGIAFGR